MTCRDEILECANQIVERKSVNEFTILEILDCMQAQDSEYPESTIRTHVASRMCSNAKKNHPKKYDDFCRIKHGLYRLN